VVDVTMSTSGSTVVTVNAGSSSLHLHVVRLPGEVLARRDVRHPPASEPAARALTEFCHEVAERFEVGAVGHRLVHGGPAVQRPTVADRATLRAAGQAATLAPMHVPASLRLAETAMMALPQVPHVLCPDTAFHADLPEPASTYSLPHAWRQKFGLRRYGFHGLSYAWAVRRAAELLGREVSELQLLLTHLGGGCSVCAVRAGRSVDTSMGFTPLEGVPMTTRSGSVDPGMLLWLIQHGGLDVDEVADGLYHRSGLLGLSMLSDDTRELVPAAERGHKAAALALNVFTHGVRRGLAAMVASLSRIDALVFTGEIGWAQSEVRQAVCAGLRVLGVRGALANLAPGVDDGTVSTEGVPVLAVRPREELQIASDTAAAVG
jgi:acetate kinase